MSGWFKFWELFFKLKDIISKSFFFFFFLLLLFLLLSFDLEGGIFLFCFSFSGFSSFLLLAEKSIPPTYIWVLKLFKIFSFVLFSFIDFWKLFIIPILIFYNFNKIIQFISIVYGYIINNITINIKHNK